MYRLCTAAVLAMIISPAWATVRIDVNYDMVVNEVQPEIRMLSGRGGTEITLNNDGTVTKNMNGGVSTNSLNGYVSSITKSGLTSISHYRVSNGSITEFFENETQKETLVISTNGVNYCTAHANFHPPRGQRYIIWGANRELRVSSIRAINVTCRIQKLS